MHQLINNENIGKFNTFLILISFFCSLLFPFATFIIAYSLLGPLHYLTQLNWINNKPEIESRLSSYKLILITGSLIISIIYILAFYNLISLTSEYLLIILTSIVIVIIGISAIYVLPFNRKYIIIIFLGIILLTTVALSNFRLLILFGVLLSSIIHVFLFTFLHMLNGALKFKSKTDLFNVLIMIMVPLLLYLLPKNILFFSTISETQNSTTTALAANLSAFFGYPFLTEESLIRFASFISFAYLYHYLNWFSKTKIIQWDSSLTTRKTIKIAIISASFSSIYLLGFEYGLLATLFLSYLHVFAEIPLNYYSIQSIMQIVMQKIKLP